MGRRLLPLFILCALFLMLPPLWGEPVSVDGAPADTGFNVGTVATIRAVVHGITGDASRYAVFAEIQYAGTTSTTDVQMNQDGEAHQGDAHYEVGWPIPAEAPTGLYTVAVRVEDRTAHRTVATKKLRGFGAYKKLLRISHLAIDRTFYNVGEPIQCEMTLESLSDKDLKDLRVEFSNENYPWISLFAPGSTENLDLSLKVLRDHLALPAHGEARIPMMPAGTAAFLQGKQKEVMGTGGPVRSDKTPPPEVDRYTVAVWNADRTVLYDMQFTSPAIVRPLDRVLPKPYSRNFTHPYNSDIDYKGYREFYPPGLISSAISVDHSHTLYRPGDTVNLKLDVLNENGGAAAVRARIQEPGGRAFEAPASAPLTNTAKGARAQLSYEVWKIPVNATPGIYSITLSLTGPDAKSAAETTTEIAVNHLPSSLLVFCPHEDDEHSYAGLVRAAVEAGIPVRVVIFTGGDVGECERYYDKPCGPNEAREFGMVRMEESAESLEHMGLTRDKLMILGLPDGGSGEIWSRNLEAANPFLSIYLACDHAPYENVLKPNLPFARHPVIDLVKQIITEFRPAMIALPHPDERHVDHRTANWFVIKACQELLKANAIDPKTVVLADQAYGAGGFKPAPYKYEKAIVYLSGEASALKQEAGWIYQSQDGNLAEGMKERYRELPRQENHLRILDWQEHEGWNE